MNKKIKVKNIISVLECIYPYAKCSLIFEDPLQLLVATQLSAQCTDKRVNEVTKDLFKKYRSAYDYANADLDELINIIRPTGFFRNKSKNIINCCKTLVSNYNGRIPDSMEELTKLSGVGRKTANLILGTIYNIPGIVVDTHVKRISWRLGFTKSDNADIVEKDLMKIIPENKWINFSHLLVSHGRAICKSRKPLCNDCKIFEYCPYGIVNKE